MRVENFTLEVEFCGLHVLDFLTRDNLVHHQSLILGNNYFLDKVQLLEKGNDIFYMQNNFQVENCGLQISKNNNFFYLDVDHTQWLMFLQNLSLYIYLR